MRSPVWKNSCMADYSAKGWTLVYNYHYSEHLNQEKQNIYIFTQYYKIQEQQFDDWEFFFLTGHNPQ